MKVFKSVIFYMLIVSGLSQHALESRSFMGNIKEGIRYAGNLLGISTASDVANLVARAFSSDRRVVVTPPTTSVSSYKQYVIDAEQPKSDDTTTKTTNNHNPIFNVRDLLTNVLRLIGFDVNKLGALALNAIVLIGQAISNSFKQQPPLTDNESHYAENQSEGRALRRGTPLDWFLEEPTTHMFQLLNNALEGDLTDRLVNAITQLEKGTDQGGCLKLLVCRSSPFIWGMQRTLQQFTETRNQTTPTNRTASDSNYTHMPTLEEYQKYAKMCNQKYDKSCQLHASY